MPKHIVHTFRGILFIKRGKKWFDEQGVEVKGKKYKTELQADYHASIQKRLIKMKGGN